MVGLVQGAWFRGVSDTLATTNSGFLAAEISVAKSALASTCEHQ
jgi:hypothetical protein